MVTNSWDSELSENKNTGPRGPARHTKVGSEGVLAWRCGMKSTGERHFPWVEVGWGGWTHDLRGLAFSGSCQNESSMALKLGDSKVLNFWMVSF